MQDSMKKIFITEIIMILFGVIIMGVTSVAAYEGSGTKGKPYIVKNENDYATVLTSKSKSRWVYIAIGNNITITKTIIVQKGKFRIYAKDQSRTIKRSSDAGSVVNKNPSYCMILDGSTHIEFGNYKLSGYVINLDGNRSDFEKRGVRSSGWMYIKADARLTLNNNSSLKNVINNKINADGSAIRCVGELNVNGKISNCKGVNGGAIKVQGGSLTVNLNTEIRDCESVTEGGAIYGYLGCSVTMEGGAIRNCKSAEEGGGIFISGQSVCRINGGTISNNEAGKSAGGVFAGYGASLFVGTQGNGGPEISYNNAKGSGGGVRCNGGETDYAGGVTYFYGGKIKNNYAGKNGGGISCGPSNPKMESRIYLKDIKVENNRSVNGGGGIRIAENVHGTSGGNIVMQSCTFNGNNSQSSGGGIILYSNIEATDSVFSNNTCKNNGGGININEGGTLHMKNSYSRENNCGGNGKGVYVFGLFKISGDTYIDLQNDVYLTKNTYIDVVGKLNKASGLIADIKSEINDNGTKLVRANYTGTTPSKELYYNNVADDEYNATGIENKKYRLSNSPNKVLRPSEKVNGITNEWIIISEKYEIKYNKNCSDNVVAFPIARKKFWNEDAIIWEEKIIRKGFTTSQDRHWNTKADGTGECIKPASAYKKNANVQLYAIWEKAEVTSITIIPKTRYYIKGQKIVLDKDELLKKVFVKDNLDTDTVYDLRITEISDSETDIVKGEDIKPENYITTKKCNIYTVTLETKTKNGNVTAKATMIVYVLESPGEWTRVRFVSIDYLDTLTTNSKWYRSLNNIISLSLKKKQGEGLCTIDINKDKVNEIKSRVKNNGYKIDGKINKSLSDELKIQIK